MSDQKTQTADEQGDVQLTIAQILAQLAQETPEAVQAARDELEREYNIRERCYPRWIGEGRVSKTDANDRLARQKKAMEIVDIALDILRAS